jgi:hypothetical protein
MKQKNSLCILCFTCCISIGLTTSSFGNNPSRPDELNLIKEQQRHKIEQKIREILGPDADLNRFKTPLQAQLEKMRREKQKTEKLANHVPVTAQTPERIPAAPTQQEIVAPQDQPIEQITAPEQARPAAPKQQARPKNSHPKKPATPQKEQPKPSPAIAPVTQPVQPQPISQPQANPVNQQNATPSKPESKPRPTMEKPFVNVANVIGIEISDLDKRKLSLKLFSTIIPVLASYNEERLFGKVLEKDTLANQKHAAQTISMFIQKLSEKLKRINDSTKYEFLKSTNFRSQSWSQELFTRLHAVFAFCKKQLKQYQTITEQPDGIKELKNLFESKILELNQLSRQYFNYNPTDT